MVKINIQRPNAQGVLDDATEFIKETQEEFLSDANKKAKRIARLRAGATRKVSLANKRAKRLEKNKLTDTPAYQQYIKGGGRFSVKGKSHNELMSEIGRLNRFINAESSTVRGANKILKDTAKLTGIKYKNLTELRAKAASFFEASSKIEQLLRSQHDMASAIGYQKIWEAVNEYVQKERIDLAKGAQAIDDVVERVTQALATYEEPISGTDGEFRLLDMD